MTVRRGKEVAKSDKVVGWTGHGTGMRKGFVQVQPG